MLSVLEQNILIILLFCLLFQRANLTYYISFEIIEIDDCIRKIYIADQLHFTYTPERRVCDPYFNDRADCDPSKKFMYPTDLMIIKNYEYKLGTEIKIIFEDWNRLNGYMKMNVIINEYTIKPVDQSFWKCIDCTNSNNDYVYESSYQGLKFHPEGKNECNEDLYTFIFRIDDIKQLYKGGKDNQRFEINYNYYTFTSNEYYFEKYVNYSEGDIELQLINFNEEDFIRYKDNWSFIFKNNDFLYRINNDDFPEGQLNGLDSNNVKIRLTKENPSFICDDNSGLNYILGDNEKEGDTTTIELYITVYNNCPNYIYNCNTSPLTQSAKFTFKIHIFRPPIETTVPETYKPSDTIQPTEQFPDTTQQTDAETTQQIDTETTQQTDAETTQQTDTETTQQTDTETTQQTDTETTQQTDTETTQQTDTETTQQTDTETTQQTDTETTQQTDSTNNISLDTSSYDLLSNNKEEILDCMDHIFSHDDKYDISTYLCLNFSKDNILNNTDDIVKKIDENKNYKIIGNDFVAQIFPIDYLDENNTKNNTEIFSSSSFTNFTECEKILRDVYKIESPRKIIFIQIELNNTNDDILINQLEYQAFADNNTKLNLSLCEKANITTYYELTNDKKEEVDLISYFKKKGIDILDTNDKFFNDICLPYSDSENDLTLNDRIKDIYKNYTFCEKNCKLIEINFEEYKAKCDCTTKENMNVTDFNFDSSNIQTKKQNNNFKIIKCYNGFTSIKDNLNNIGFWIFLGLMILNILLLILYFCGFKKIKQYLGLEMANHGYIGKSDGNIVFCHNYVKQLDKLIQRLNQMKNNLFKKGEPPKKAKKRKHSSLGSDRNKFLIYKKPQSKKSQKDLKKDIKLLKCRMDKTKKVKSFSTKDAINRENKTGLEKYKVENYIENNNFKLNLININVNEVKKKAYVPNLSGDILNIYNFNEAIQYDKRNFCTIYYIFLIAKQVIMHAFFYKSPIEPLAIRLSLLKFMLGCDLALNAIFYTDNKVSEKYNSAKSAIVFAFTNNLIVILLSTLIGYVMFLFLAKLNNSTNEIRDLFREEEEKIKNNKKYTVSLIRKKQIIDEVKKIIKCYKIKIIIFYIIEFACMIFFWYYVTVFCNIYKKTQLSWLIDCAITIIVRIIIDFVLNLILALLYILSISLKSNCFYRVIIFFYCFS